MKPVYTVGHSNRSRKEFLALLREHGIGLVVDVRRFPVSRRNPHFSQEALTATLKRASIAYVHEPDLGGRRTPHRKSPNTAWRSEAFRAYADHMASAEFQAAVSRLVEHAERWVATLLCAEALPSRCHRQLIADALVARGAPVTHILGPGRTEEHTLNPLARVDEGGRLIYPAEPGNQLPLF